MLELENRKAKMDNRIDANEREIQDLEIKKAEVAAQLAGLGERAQDYKDIEVPLTRKEEKELELDREKVNVNGGAVAIGHPLGATGIRLTTTLLYELRRRGARYGLAAACAGGGQGMALIIEALP